MTKTTRRGVGIIVQARMSSSRLPGKVLKPLAGEPSLARQMERLKRARSVDGCLIATSVHPSDDQIEEFCRSRGYECVRGSLEDVLARYYEAATAAGMESIVRVTADCPLIDPALVDDCVEEYLAHSGEVDYVSNANGGAYPQGLDVEVFSYQMLEQAFRLSRLPEDREHVTPYIIRNSRKRMVGQAVNLADLRWTLDYQDDYEAIAAVFEDLYEQNPAFDTTDVYRLLLRRPELLRVNSRAELDPGQREILMSLVARQVAINEGRLVEEPDGAE